MIKINNMSKSAFKKVNMILPDGWYAKDFLVEEADTVNITLSDDIQITRPSGEYFILLSLDTRTIDVSFNEFSELRMI